MTDYDVNQLQADLISVVSYNWNDEARDYAECDPPEIAKKYGTNSREGHVFEPLQRLAKFCGYR